MNGKNICGWEYKLLKGSSFNGSYYIITLFGYEFINFMYLYGTIGPPDGYFAWIRVINGYLLGILVF
jgi:hypothetical protein